VKKNAVALCILGTVSPARAGILETSWIAPTVNADGSVLTELASYRIYYGPSVDRHPLLCFDHRDG
jgi:hypothetical protein